MGRPRRQPVKLAIGNDDVPGVLERMGEVLAHTQAVAAPEVDSRVAAGARGEQRTEDTEQDFDVEVGSLEDNRAELKRLRESKQKLTQRLLGMSTPEKTEIDFLKFQLATIDSQEKACRENLKMFHKKRLEGMDGVDMVRIEIVAFGSVVAEGEL